MNTRKISWGHGELGVSIWLRHPVCRRKVSLPCARPFCATEPTVPVFEACMPFASFSKSLFFDINCTYMDVLSTSTDLSASIWARLCPHSTRTNYEPPLGGRVCGCSGWHACLSTPTSASLPLRTATIYIHRQRFLNTVHAEDGQLSSLSYSFMASLLRHISTFPKTSSPPKACLAFFLFAP